MADKKPVYNPPANDDTSVTSTATKKNAGAPRSGFANGKLGVGAIVGISAAGLALLIGASVAGSAITLAISHNDRGHSQQDALGGMPGDGGRDGNRDGQRGGLPGKGGDGDGPMDGRTPHQHDANGNDIVPDGRMPGGPLPDGQQPGGQLPPAPSAAPQTN